MNERLTANLFHRLVTFRVVNVLILIVCIAAFTRSFNLTFTGLWLDEIYSMNGSDPSKTFTDVYVYSKNDQPPLFFFILRAWLGIFGSTDTSGRILMVLIGLTGVTSMYFLGREFWNAKVGLIAAFLTSINWYHVGVSMEIRFYGLVFFLSAASYLFFLRALKKQETIDFLLYSIFTALVLNTHYFGMVLLATQFSIFLAAIAFFNRPKRLVIGGLLSGLVAGLSLVHWMPVIFHDLQITNHYIQSHTLRYMLKFIWWVIYDPLAFVVFIGCVFLTLRIFYRQIRDRAVSLEMFVLLGWLFIGFAIPLVYSFVKMPLFSVKYCTIQYPGLFLLVAYGFSMIRNPRMQSYLLMSLIGSACIVLFFARPPYKRSWHEDGREFLIMYFTADQSGIKSWNEDWREVAMYFKERNYGEREVIFSQLAWFHDYYFKKFGLKPPLDQNVDDFTGGVASADHVWLLMHAHYTGGWSINGFSDDQKQIIKEGFNLVDIVYFRNSRALLYTRKPPDMLLAVE